VAAHDAVAALEPQSQHHNRSRHLEIKPGEGVRRHRGVSHLLYYIVHSTIKQLPKLACKNCKHKFHSACIHRWFNTSNKSDCPLCKS
jgi:hypothetical protein